jgi:hypothetical protein
MFVEDDGGNDDDFGSRTMQSSWCEMGSLAPGLVEGGNICLKKGRHARPC